MAFFENLNKTNKPSYFHDDSYDPNFEDSSQAFSYANVILDHIPDLRNWLFDKLRQEAHGFPISEKLQEKIDAVLQSARNYDSTTKNLSPYDTVITQLYTDELLIKILLYCYGKESATYHGYTLHTDSFKAFDFAKIGDVELVLKRDGLAQNLHELFYVNKFNSSPEKNMIMPNLGEYFCFLPEIRNDLSRMGLKTRSCTCDVGWGATGVHPKEGTYHYFNVNNSVEINKFGLNISTLFPEIVSEYIIANGYSKSNLFETNHCDNLVSATCDINGNNFALGFGGSAVRKQTDIEIRFYVIFLLGSIARYYPDLWEGIRTKNKNWYFLISRFLEHNQYLFPMLILRYISGRTYQLGTIGRLR